MASISSMPAIFPGNSVKQSPLFGKSSTCSVTASPATLPGCSWNKTSEKRKRPSTVVAAVGDVSADGTTYLIAGAALVAILGTGFPILFSRKDM